MDPVTSCPGVQMSQSIYRSGCLRCSCIELSARETYHEEKVGGCHKIDQTLPFAVCLASCRGKRRPAHHVNINM